MALSEWKLADLPSRDRLLHQWRPPVVSEHVKSTLNPDTANVGTRSQKQATQAGSSASSGARSSRDLPSLSQSSWDPGGQACRGWHRLNPAKSTVQRNDTTREFTGGPSDSFDLCVCVKTRWCLRCGDRPHPGLELPSAPPRAERELQNERVRRESSIGQPEERVPPPNVQKVPTSRRSIASSQSSLYQLDDGGHLCGMRSTVREVRSTTTQPAAAQRRVARSFHPFRDVKEVPRKSRSHSTIAPRDVISKTSMANGQSPKVGSAAVCSLRNGVLNATKEIILSWAAEPR